MATNSRAHNLDDGLLRIDQGSEDAGNRAHAHSFGTNLNALTFKPWMAHDFLVSMGVPIIASRQDILKAMILHECLKGFKQYVPKLFPTVHETAGYILRHTELLIPGYEIKSNGGRNLEDGKLEDILESMKEHRYFVNMPMESVYTPTSCPDIVMEYAGLMEHKDQSYYPVLISAMQLLNVLGFEDLREGEGGWEASDDGALYDEENEYFQNMVESFSQHPDQNEIIADNIRKECALRKEVVHPLLIEMKKKPNMELLKTFVQFDGRSDLSMWIEHLLQMHEAGFNFPHFIMDIGDGDDAMPVNALNCIGLAYDLNQYCYQFHCYDMEAYSNEAGYSPVGPYLHYGMDGEAIKSQNIPVMRWVRNALSFNLYNLTFYAGN